MKQTILSNWNFFRVLRLLIGIAVIVQAIIANDALFGFAGLIFSTMALFNASCCGYGGCNTTIPEKNASKQEISFEEVE